MRWLQRPLCGRVNGPFQIAVFGLVDCREQIKVTLAMFLFPVWIVS